MLFTPRDNYSTDKLQRGDRLPIVEQDLLHARHLAQTSFEPRKNVLRRRLPWIAILACSGTALFIAAGLFLPPTYTSKAQLIIEPQPKAADISTDGTGTHAADPPGANGSLAIETHMGILSTRDFLQSALSGETASRAKNFKTDIEKPSAQAVGPMSASELFRRLGVWTDALLKSPKSETPGFDDIEKRVKITQEGHSDIISIGFTSTDPAQSSEVVNRIAEAYVESSSRSIASLDKKRDRARYSAYRGHQKRGGPGRCVRPEFDSPATRKLLRNFVKRKAIRLPETPRTDQRSCWSKTIAAKLTKAARIFTE